MTYLLLLDIYSTVSYPLLFIQSTQYVCISIEQELRPHVRRYAVDVLTLYCCGYPVSERRRGGDVSVRN